MASSNRSLSRGVYVLVFGFVLYALGTAANGAALSPWHRGRSHDRPLDRTLPAGARASAASVSAAATFETARLVLSPQDTFLNINATNYSTEATLATYTWPDYQVANAIVMKFDLSSLPAGVIVQEARLNLALVQSDTALESTYTVTAHKLLGKNPDITKASGSTADGITGWTPNACCHNGLSLAQADISPAYNTAAIDKAPGFKAWDVTTLVQEWVLDQATNFGLLLNADASMRRDRYRVFASMEHADSSLRPFLSVTYVASDVVPPSVAITAPTAGAVSGIVPVAATAADNLGVASVQFQIDGSPFGSALTTVPYALDWDTTTVSDATYTLTAVARDWSGNVAAAPGISVMVKNGILLLSPQDTSLNINANNYSADTVLTTYTWPDYKGSNAVLMKFDVSAVPPGAFVEEATVRLALVQSDATLESTYSVSAHKVLGKSPVISQATGYTADGVTNWTPSVCCYNGVPLAQADISPPYDRPAIDKTPGFKSWTITGMVQEWLADPATNFGLLLNSDASKPRDRYRFFASMEHGNAGLRPYLRVKYSSTPDGTPPAVSISAPAGGTIVSGTVAVQASATDDVRVVGVQFKLDGVTLGAEDTTNSYWFSWDTTTVPNGTYTLTAMARDAAGNATTCAGVSVTVANDTTAPTVSISAPAGGTTVSSTVTVSAAASDNVGVVGVQFTRDGVNLGTEDTTAPYSVSWNTTTVANGSHTLTAVARDAAGNVTTSATVTVTVANDTTAPTVSMSAPAGGTTVSGTVTVSAAASDNVGVFGVQFKRDGVNLGAEDTTSPYTMSWSTATVANGSHMLTAMARDAAGNQTTSAGVTVTVSNVAPPPSSILWSADHEEGNMSDWYVNSGGNESNSGNAVSGASRDVAHTGSWSAKGTITTPGGAGVRLFRKARSNPDPNTYAYYSAWYYIPVRMTSADFNNIFQFKSLDSAGVSDPFWDLKIRNRSNGNMYVTLNWWCGLTVEGPHRGESGCRTYQQTLKDLPVGQWFHLEAFLRQSDAFAGQIIIWQDGVEIFNQNNVKSRYSTSTNDWSINNYGDHVVPSPFTIYFDDAAVSSARLGAGTSDTTPPTVSLSGPAPGATVSSTVSVSASVSDNVGVVGVQFKVDGANWGAEDTTAPFSMSWNSALFANGAHSLSAVARDAAGNTAASAPVSVTVSNTATSCQTSGASWQNQAFAPQSGTFTAQFDATPGANNIDGVTGLNAGTAATYTHLAAIVRFNSWGNIDARNGGAYAALASIPYVAGTTYRVRMVVNVPTHSYSVYVTPSGGSEQALGLNYAFRSEQAAANTLSALASFTNGGILQVCNFTVSAP